MSHIGVNSKMPPTMKMAGTYAEGASKTWHGDAYRRNPRATAQLETARLTKTVGDCVGLG